MEGTGFIEFVDLCYRLEKERGKKGKVGLLKRFLKGLRREEIASAILLTTARIFPLRDKRKLNISASTLSKVLKDTGPPPGSPTLTIGDVHATFSAIASVTGKGATSRRERTLKELLERATGPEREWIVRIIIGEMRHGAGEGLLLQALAELAGLPLETMERAYMVTGDLGRLGEIVLTEGRKGVEGLSIRPFTPLKPMLAEMACDIDKVLREHGGTSAFEYKFDGARVQIHRQEERIAIFTRHLKEVTESLPDVVKRVEEGVSARDVILDGEVIATGRDGRPLPFQDLMRRFKRVYDIGRMVEEIPARLYLFDILYLEGRPLIDLPYRERRERLEALCHKEIVAPARVISEKGEVERFLDQAIEVGHEGLVAKALDSRYTPGKRGKRWFKLKPAETLDLVIVAADWGHGRRKGWLSNYHLAVRDRDTGDYLPVGKTFKGLTDKEFEEMTRRLLLLKVGEEGFTVFVRPRVVVEVAYNEIQKSPTYPSGLALRFARIKRIRDDKGPEDADTIERLRRLYLKQFERKARRL